MYSTKWRHVVGMQWCSLSGIFNSKSQPVSSLLLFQHRYSLYVRSIISNTFLINIKYTQKKNCNGNTHSHHLAYEMVLMSTLDASEWISLSHHLLLLPHRKPNPEFCFLSSFGFSFQCEHIRVCSWSVYSWVLHVFKLHRNRFISHTFFYNLPLFQWLICLWESAILIFTALYH